MQTLTMLNRPYTDEDFLAHQRQIHAAYCQKKTAGTLELEKDKTYVSKRLEWAENMLQNRCVLPGSGGKLIDIGTPIAWKERRTEDNEYVWHLNRMEYFTDFVNLYFLTGERKYVDKVVFDMRHWMEECPLPEIPEVPVRGRLDAFCGVYPWRSLEVGIRMFATWSYVYERLLLTDFMTVDLHTRLTKTFYEHGLALRKVSPVLWPNANHNHYLHEMLGLFIVSCLFPDFKESSEWQVFSAGELCRCAENQLTPEGGQIEGCPGYHNGCLGQFFDALRVGRDFGVAFPDRLLDLCKKAAEYSAFALTPSGKHASIGDTSIGRVGMNVPKRYYECFGELGATAYMLPLIDPIDPLYIPTDVQEEGRARALAMGPCDNYQKTLGQYMARTGFAPDDSYFHFACHLPVTNGHSHIDPLSFILCLNGDDVTVDPSYYAYRECPERKEVKSAEFHSTLLFDHKPPFNYVNLWAFTPQKEGSLASSYHVGDVFAADGSHKCYEPNEHRRLCALIGKDVFAVVDDVKNADGVDVTLYFHMDDATIEVRGGEAVSDRVRVLLPEGVPAEAVDSYKSLHTDIVLPTRRLVLNDTRHAEKQTYVTIFTKRADVKNPTASYAEGGVRFSVTVGEEERRFLWKYNESLREE